MPSAPASSCNVEHHITTLVEITGSNPCASAATKLKEARLQAVPRLSELSVQLQVNEFSDRLFQHDIHSVHFRNSGTLQMMLWNPTCERDPKRLQRGNVLTTFNS
jgi:hypothetical protein